MGKPSLTRLSMDSKQSNTSRKKMNAAMSNVKVENCIKRMQRKSRVKIKQLFERLRNQSDTSITSQENTVICLDTPSPKKRKLSNPNISVSNKVPKLNSERLIIIKDDDIISCSKPGSSVLTPVKRMKSSPIHSSTPISVSKQSIDLTNVSRIGNSNNNTLVNNGNESKVINKDSYLTIDLTTESNVNKSDSKSTIIDLVHSGNALETSTSDNFSISGESEVTVIAANNNKKERIKKQIVSGIAKLDGSEQGRILQLITQRILGGCDVQNLRGTMRSKGTETAEDTYIKEVILGQSQSRNSIGSNIYNPERDIKNKSGLRMIVIDGSNVAMEHGKGKFFSVKGLKICIDYFLKRGHIVKAFVPRFRCKFGKSTDPRLLDELERKGLIVYTPSREIQGKMISSYDDRYIVQCAAEFDGVIVSGDNYRDLLQENPRWRFIIENRLLQFTWVNDMIMFPKDPLGRYGPSLEALLRHSIQTIPL